MQPQPGSAADASTGADSGESKLEQPNLAIKVRRLDEKVGPRALYQFSEKAGWRYTLRDCLFLHASPDVEAFGIFAVPVPPSPTAEAENQAAGGSGHNGEHGGGDARRVDGDSAGCADTKVGKCSAGDELLIGTTIVSFCGTYTGIGLVVVAEAFRRRGIASRLVEHAIAVSRQRPPPNRDTSGDEEVNLSQPNRVTLVASQMGEPLYRKLDFEVKGPITMLRLPIVDGQAPLAQAAQKAVLPPGHRLLSFFLGELVGAKSNQKSAKGHSSSEGVDRMQLLTDALRMADEAINGTRGRLTMGFLAEGSLHMIVRDVDANGPHHGKHRKASARRPGIAAWCGVRACSDVDRYIGPVIAHSSEMAQSLILNALPAQLSLEDQVGHRLVGNREGSNGAAEQSFLISLDSRYAQANQGALDGGLEGNLRAEGFEEFAKINLMERKISTDSAQKNLGGPTGVDDPIPHQYAMLDVALS